jgi:hypothetical protein
VGGMVAAGVLALVLGWAILGDAVLAVVAAGVAAVGWWVTWPKAVERSVRKTALRLGRSSDLPAPARTRLWLDDEGLHEECNGVVTNAVWSGVQRVDETDDHGFVFVSLVSALIVPQTRGPAGCRGIPSRGAGPRRFRPAYRRLGVGTFGFGRERMSPEAPGSCPRRESALAGAPQGRPRPSEARYARVATAVGSG